MRQQRLRPSSTLVGSLWPSWTSIFHVFVFISVFRGVKGTIAQIPRFKTQRTTRTIDPTPLNFVTAHSCRCALAARHGWQTNISKNWTIFRRKIKSGFIMKDTAFPTLTLLYAILCWSTKSSCEHTASIARFLFLWVPSASASGNKALKMRIRC